MAKNDTKKVKKSKKRKKVVEDEVAVTEPKAKKVKKVKKAKKAKKVKAVKAVKAVSSVKTLRKAMKAAKAAWQADKTDKALKKVFKAAKAALTAEKAKVAAPAADAKEAEPEVAPMEEAAPVKEEAAAPAAAAADEGCVTIFCGNLPWSVDEDIIKATFKECGEVANIRWGQDRESGDFKGYAHIEFSDSSGCTKALALNGTECGGREMRIDASKPRGGSAPGGAGGAEFKGPGTVPANPDATPRCFIGNLSYKIDEDGVKNAFKEKGLTIVDVFFLTDKETGDFYGSSFCEFSSPEEAAKAVSFAGMPIMGRPIKVDFARPRPGGDSAKKKRPAREPTARPEGGSDTAFFGNLSFDIDEEKMKAWCSEQGATDLSSVRWLTDRESGEFKGCGFVQFESVESVDKIIAKNGADIMGRSARIDYANSN